MTAFLQDFDGKVELIKDAATPSATPVYFEIIGNTVWRRFICKEPGVIIQFSTDPDHHVFHNTFEIIGVRNNNVMLTRLRQPFEYDYPRDGTRPPGESNEPGTIDNSLPLVPAMRNLKGASNSEKAKFWNFNLIPSTYEHKLMDISFVTINFSHAWYQRIPIASGEMNLDVIPFYREYGDGSRLGHFNYDWVEIRRIIYSFIEDSNGNGKADRIRVQTNVPLNGDFSGFMVEVEGYNVRDTEPFKLVNDVLEVYNPEDAASFYIYLEEGPYLYDGMPIKWRVTQNDNSLLDNISKTLLVGDPGSDEVYITINTIPPRVSYSVTLPGHNEAYVRMSQPVSPYSGGTELITTEAAGRIAGINYRQTILPPHALDFYYIQEWHGTLRWNLSYPHVPENGVSSYRFGLTEMPVPSSLSSFPPIGEDPSAWYFILGDLRDMGVRTLDWSDPRMDASTYLYYPSPRYPVDWRYSRYETFIGNSHVEGLSSDDDIEFDNPNRDTEIFLPPNRVLTPEMIRRLNEGGNVEPHEFVATTNSGRRRITDVLVSIPPTNTDSENYFAWPVWARYKDPSRHQYLNPEDIFWGQMDNDDGIIWEFDGTKFLQARDISLQARVNQNAGNYEGLSLFYAFNVPAEWRNPTDTGLRGRPVGGLWLPRVSSPLFNIVPTALVNPGSSGHLGLYPSIAAPVTPDRPLFTFDLLNENGNFPGNGKLDFLLRLNITGADPNLFIARLDAPPGADLSRIDWWTMIRPFSFDVQDIRLQRGGVTVTNNVINSDNRELAYIRYHLVRPGRVTVQVYTLDGTLVRSLRRNEYREAGEYTDVWNGSNNGGRPVARGMYFVRVVAPDIDEIRKIMVVR
jgi:hypothetical protein